MGTSEPIGCQASANTSTLLRWRRGGLELEVRAEGQIAEGDGRALAHHQLEPRVREGRRDLVEAEGGEVGERQRDAEVVADRAEQLGPHDVRDQVAHGDRREDAVDRGGLPDAERRRLLDRERDGAALDLDARASARVNAERLLEVGEADLDLAELEDDVAALAVDHAVHRRIGGPDERWELR